ncbi:MAG: YfcC family protein, partial [Firmicutes bacterium]|nr:YfcC family protein [Bacillota bacterium]
MEKKKKKFSFPSAYTVLFIVLILAVALTYIIPAGEYSSLTYDEDAQCFLVTDPKGDVAELPATQETLDKLNVKADLEKFIDGSIYKPMAISGTYTSLEQNGQGVVDFIMAPINGVYETVDIMLFIFMIGGLVGIVNHLGVFNAGIGALARVSNGKEEVIIAVVTFLIALGGTSFGMAEETIAFYPILIPIFIKSGYDAMTGIAAIWCGSSIGCMFSTVNPFSVVIASNAAGINFKEGMLIRFIGLIIGVILTVVYIVRYGKKVQKNPQLSVVYDDTDRINAKLKMDEQKDEYEKMPLQFKIILI